MSELEPVRSAEVAMTDDERITLTSEMGTLSGTGEQLGGLQSEWARRQRGDRAQFEEGSIIDI